MLDPDAIAGHGFNKARKGYEADEVRAFLVNLGSRVRESQRVFADMERRLEELERRATDPKDLDAAAVTALLGEETARVLDTARQAAAEIRTKADETAQETTERATGAATEAREAADAYAQEVRRAVDEASTAIRADADAYAAELRSTAEAETTQQRADADAYAAEVRSSAEREMAERQELVDTEVTALRNAAESVLAERTAAAEVEASRIGTEAEAYAAQVRDDGDRYAEETRSSADSYAADRRGEADTYLAKTTDDADRRRAAADADLEAARSSMAADAATRQQRAEAEGEAIVADAREQGRTMVQEARTYRERVITDLADRRRAARAQLDDLAATRDALAITLSDVVAGIEASHRSLQGVAIEPRPDRDPGQDRRALEVDERNEDAVGVGVGVGEIDAPTLDHERTEGATDDDGDDDDPGAERVEPAASSSALAEVEPPVGTEVAGVVGTGPVSEPEVAPGSEEGDEAAAVAPGVDVVEETQVGDAEAVDGVEPPVDGATEVYEGHGVGEAGDGEAASVGEAGPAEDTPVEAAGIEDIFARLRAERGLGAAEEGPSDQDRSEDHADPVASTTDGDDPVGDAAQVINEAPAAGHDEEDDGPGDGAEADVEADEDLALLDRRDAATDEVERQLAKRLKRVLSDEQNEALDLLRRARGVPSADEVIPTEAEHLARFTSAAKEDLVTAERAGASFFGEVEASPSDVDDVAAEFATEMVRQIRTRLERAFDDGGDEQEVGERIRACYREWKTQRIADTARHYVIAAFSRGLADAAGEGQSFRWLVDDGGSPCPDCDDNALAGPTPRGEPFPTGDRCPPAHPGCRCLTVPADPVRSVELAGRAGRTG